MKRRSMSQSSASFSVVGSCQAISASEPDENSRSAAEALNTSGMGVNISMARTGGSFLIPRKNAAQLLQRSSSAASASQAASSSSSGSRIGASGRRGSAALLGRSKSSALLTAPQTFRIQPQLPSKAQGNQVSGNGQAQVVTAPAPRGVKQASQLSSYFQAIPAASADQE